MFVDGGRGSLRTPEIGRHVRKFGVPSTPDREAAAPPPGAPDLQIRDTGDGLLCAGLSSPGVNSTTRRLNKLSSLGRQVPPSPAPKSDGGFSPPGGVTAEALGVRAPPLREP